MRQFHVSRPGNEHPGIPSPAHFGNRSEVRMWKERYTAQAPSGSTNDKKDQEDRGRHATVADKGHAFSSNQDQPNMTVLSALRSNCSKGLRGCAVFRREEAGQNPFSFALGPDTFHKRNMTRAKWERQGPPSSFQSQSCLPSMDRLKWLSF